MSTLESVMQNICKKHFPEPIIMFQQNAPHCKKCIHDSFRKQNSKSKALNPQQVKAIAAQMGFKFTENEEFRSEKAALQRIEERLNQFEAYYKNYIEPEISKREERVVRELEEIPKLMEGIFEHLAGLLEKAEDDFKENVSLVVQEEKEKIQALRNKSLPQRLNFLKQTYEGLKREIDQCGADPRKELPAVRKYLEIFKGQEVEFERDFNKYDSVSKLHRLLEQDSARLLREFSELVDGNLRVDFNVKSSFRESFEQKVVPKLHSFQWNQKHIQVYRINKRDFYKKFVKMPFEVPLYSRSIATEEGAIFLIGGFIKQQNLYLKSCLKYDQIFEELEHKSNMINQHADHSLCSLNGFVYVVGSFVNNQVLGDCERYDVS